VDVYISVIDVLFYFLFLVPVSLSLISLWVMLCEWVIECVLYVSVSPAFTFFYLFCCSLRVWYAPHVASNGVELAQRFPRPTLCNSNLG
jgi:hypothetical protein